MTPRRGLVALIALVAVLGLAPLTPVAACPNCKSMMSEDNADPAQQAQREQQANLGRGMSYSVYVMLAVPYLLLAGFGGGIWWAIRKNAGPRQPLPGEE
jgi:hypothetical protein